MASSFPSSRIAFLTAIANMFIFSIITTSLQSIVLAFHLSLANTTSQSYPSLYYELMGIINSGTKLMLASSVIALSESIMCGIIIIWIWLNPKRTYPVPPTTLLYTLLFNGLLSLIALVNLLVVHSDSSDFEFWACHIGPYENDLPVGYCRTAKAGRILSIIYCISAAVAAIAGHGL